MQGEGTLDINLIPTRLASVVTEGEVNSDIELVFSISESTDFPIKIAINVHDKPNQL